MNVLSFLIGFVNSYSLLKVHTSTKASSYRELQPPPTPHQDQNICVTPMSHPLEQSTWRRAQLVHLRSLCLEQGLTQTSPCAWPVQDTRHMFVDQILLELFV